MKRSVIAAQSDNAYDGNCHYNGMDNMRVIYHKGSGGIHGRLDINSSLLNFSSLEISLFAYSADVIFVGGMVPSGVAVDFCR